MGLLTVEVGMGEGSRIMILALGLSVFDGAVHGGLSPPQGVWDHGHSRRASAVALEVGDVR